MSLNKGKMMAGVIATSIVIPMTGNISFANGNNVQSANIEYKTVTGNAVNLRTGPGTNSSSIGKLYKGDKVEYIGMNGSWVNVKYNGSVGYIHSDYVSNSSGNENNLGTDTEVKSTKVVTGSSVNFRTAPSTSSSKMRTLSKGTEVGYISETNGWSKISHNGKIGYMSSKYVGDKGYVPPVEEENLVGDTEVKSTKVVSGASVNFRTGPSTSNSKLGTLSKGTEVGYISEANGWSKINHNGKIGYMSSKYIVNKGSLEIQPTIPETPVQPPSPIGNSVDAVIEYSKGLLGKSYVWGAEGPDRFDCSGFTKYVLKNSVGVNLPRVSKAQSTFGQLVNKSDIQKGDLLFFDTDGANNGSVSHVGIYMGNGEMIHCSSGKGKVVISNMNSNYYNNAYVNARRVL